MTSPVLPPGFIAKEHLGKGGTADVYRAWSDSLGRDVALKLSLQQSGSNDNIPFETLVARESELIGKYRFPGLVRILDASRETPGYLALEICNGPAMDSVGRIDSLPLAMNILCALALDLELLRAIGIVHGDLKPQNVFLPADWKRHSGKSVFWVKLSDFSLGKKDNEADNRRIGLGTVGYLAPETIVDGRADHASDLFALGVTAYQVLTGVHPFMENESDPVQINSRCREDDPPPVSKYREDIPENLDHLIAGLLAKSPSDRPKSAGEVCQKLRQDGAEYPFDRALRPGDLIPADVAYADAVAAALTELSDDSNRWLDTITGRDTSRLRLILSTAHRRGDLAYRNGRFAFTTRPYWPAGLRRETLQSFRKAPNSVRKDQIRAAVLGEPDTLSTEESQSGHMSPLTILLRPLLRPSTVRRLSRCSAVEAEQREEHDLATRLALQAGDFDRAERCGFQAASRFQNQHRVRRAIRVIDAVVDYGELIGRFGDTLRLIKTRGDVLKVAGETEAALHTYNKIVNAYTDRKPDTLLAKTYKSLGDLFKMKQCFADGVAALDKAREIYERDGNELELSHTYNNIGNLYFIDGDRREARRHYLMALRVQRRLGAAAEVASTLSNMGGVEAMTGRLKRAIRLLNISLILKREIGNAGEIARSLNNMGYIYYLLGDKDRAIESLTESLELNRRIESRKEMLFNFDNLTAVMIAAGRLKESLRYLNEGTELAKKLDDSPHRAIFYRNTATVLRRMGRLGEVDPPLRAAERLLDELDDREEQVRLVISRACLRAAFGDAETAVELADHAITLAESINCKPEKLNALILKTRVTDSAQTASEALELAETLNMQRERILIQANCLRHHLLADRMEQAGTIVNDVAGGLRNLTADLELPGILLLLGRYSLAVGDTARAESLLNRADTLAEQSGLTLERIQTLTLLGRVRTRQGSFEEAFGTCKQALQQCRAIADGIPDSDNKQRFMATPAVKDLVAEIGKLQQKIGQKAGAGR